MTQNSTPSAWSTPAPADAYRVVVDAAGQCAHGLSLAARADLAVAADRLGEDALAVAAVQALARLLAGQHASAWWSRLRAEVNDYTSPEDAAAVVATLETVALAEAVERGAYARAAELAHGSELQPADHAAVGCQLLGMVAAHTEDCGAATVAVTLERLGDGLIRGAT